MFIFNLFSTLIFVLFTALPVHASNSKFSRPITTDSGCSFPRLYQRLYRMIGLNEPEAFEVILRSECRGKLDPKSVHHNKLFDHLLDVSATRDVSPFLHSIMTGESYSQLMIHHWSIHKPPVSLPTLTILKSHFKHLDSSLLFLVSLQYPAGSPERLLLNEWLVELQRPMLNWPFPPKDQTTSDPPSPLKSKSTAKLTSNSFSWSQFENVPGITSEADQSESKTDIDTQEIPIVFDENIIDQSQEQEQQQELRFGHIYGWVSRNNNPIVRNSQQPFQLSGHSVKLHDTFLSFASPRFRLEDFAKSAKNPSKSFFDLPNSALQQKLKQSAGNKNFAACRLKGNGELQAMLKGDLMLVVLGQRSTGQYDYKYPENPYHDFINRSKALHSLTIDIAESDIVLFLPRSLFSDSEKFISPHDIPGAFHYTDLGSFAGMFVNFINYVHYKTNHRGLIAVGGFVHSKK